MDGSVWLTPLCVPQDPEPAGGTGWVDVPEKAATSGVGLVGRPPTGGGRTFARQLGRASDSEWRAEDEHPPEGQRVILSPKHDVARAKVKGGAVMKKATTVPRRPVPIPAPPPRPRAKSSSSVSTFSLDSRGATTGGVAQEGGGSNQEARVAVGVAVAPGENSATIPPSIAGPGNTGADPAESSRRGSTSGGRSQSSNATTVQAPEPQPAEHEQLIQDLWDLKI